MSDGDTIWRARWPRNSGATDGLRAGEQPGRARPAAGPGRAVRARGARLLDQVGVRPGWRAVDVGCGPLGILDLLAERVAPGGQVVGLDREPRMLAMARAVVAAVCYALFCQAWGRKPVDG